MDVSVCPNCDSIVKEDVCLKCGYLFVDQKELKRTKKEKPKEEPILSKVASIFTELDTESITKNLDESEEVVLKTPPRIYPVFLGLLLLVLGMFSYWHFIYLTPDYLSPLVLSAHDIRDLVVNVNGIDVDSIPLTNINSTEKTLDFKSTLVEGNFETGNFAQFAHPNINLFIQAFGINDVYKNYISGPLLKTIQTDYGISDDDLDVYFSKGFAVVLPDKDLNMWGFVIEVKDKDYVSERLVKFKKNKEDKNYELANIEMALVEVTNTPDGEKASVGEGDKSIKEKDSKTSDDPQGDKVLPKAEGTRYYLLMSDSKEFLDQMKESSEGNLPNLKEDIIFAGTKADLPKLGQSFVYKKEDSVTWKLFVDKFALKFDYVGLGKILKNVNSNGIVFYSIGDKFKIIPSKTLPS